MKFLYSSIEHHLNDLPVNSGNPPIIIDVPYGTPDWLAVAIYSGDVRKNVGGISDLPLHEQVEYRRQAQEWTETELGKQWQYFDEEFNCYMQLTLLDLVAVAETNVGSVGAPAQ